MNITEVRKEVSKHLDVHRKEFRDIGKQLDKLAIHPDDDSNARAKKLSESTSIARTRLNIHHSIRALERADKWLKDYEATIKEN